MIRILILFIMILTSKGILAKPVEIVFWHSMAGSLGFEVQKLVDEFNQRQSEFSIKSIYKGDYSESLTRFAAAFQAKQSPDLIQIFEVGSATMLNPKGIIKPVSKLLHEQGLKLPENDIFPAIKANYSDKGQWMAMPFNTSIPVMYYDAGALKKLGYSSKNFPKTWDALETLMTQLKASGFSCGYTSAYPSWIFIESFSALHGLPMLDPVTHQAIYNGRAQINFLNRLLRWQRMHYFEYGGRSDDATHLFTSGRCPLFSQSSGAYHGLSQMATFHVGMAAIPYDQNLSQSRRNNVIGGAALWVVAGKSPETYRGVAQFLAYLAEPAVQNQWYRRTGYLLLGFKGVYKLFTKQGLTPTLRIAKTDLQESLTRDPAINVPAANQIRAINDQALENIFARIQSPEAAMKEAIHRANLMLDRFARNTTQSLNESSHL